MCRLLLVKADNEFEMLPYLERFSAVCENSREYQGHGWGMAYLSGEERREYKSLTPIWEDRLEGFGSTRFLMAHARSAFQDKDIAIQNNMPFIDDPYVFIFNGELRGVKIKTPGRIGAEKLFNVLLRFNKGDITEAARRTVSFIQKRTSHIRAMNFMVTDMNKTVISSLSNGEPDYFTMYRRKINNGNIGNNGYIICSAPFPNETEGNEAWEPIQNNSIEVYS